MLSAGIMAPVIVADKQHWVSGWQTTGIIAWAVAESLVLTYAITALERFIWDTSRSMDCGPDGKLREASWWKDLSHLLIFRARRVRYRWLPAVVLYSNTMSSSREITFLRAPCPFCRVRFPQHKMDCHYRR